MTLHHKLYQYQFFLPLLTTGTTEKVNNRQPQNTQKDMKQELNRPRINEIINFLNKTLQKENYSTYIFLQQTFINIVKTMLIARRTRYFKSKNKSAEERETEFLINNLASTMRSAYGISDINEITDLFSIINITWRQVDTPSNDMKVPEYLFLVSFKYTYPMLRIEPTDLDFLIIELGFCLKTLLENCLRGFLLEEEQLDLKEILREPNNEKFQKFKNQIAYKTLNAVEHQQSQLPEVVLKAIEKKKNADSNNEFLAFHGVYLSALRIYKVIIKYDIQPHKTFQKKNTSYFEQDKDKFLLQKDDLKKASDICVLEPVISEDDKIT